MFLKFLKWRREAAPGGSVPEEQVRRELAQDKVCMGGVDRAGRPFLVAFPARHFSAGRDMAEFKSSCAHGHHAGLLLHPWLPPRSMLVTWRRLEPYLPVPEHT
jgi:hypothetical protein